MKAFAEAFNTVVTVETIDLLLANVNSSFTERFATPEYRQFLDSMKVIILEDIQKYRTDPEMLVKKLIFAIHAVFECGTLVGCEMTRPNLVF